MLSSETLAHSATPSEAAYADAFIVAAAAAGLATLAGLAVPHRRRRARLAP